MPSTEKLAVVSTAEASAKVTAPGPPALVQVAVTAPGGSGNPSSVTLPPVLTTITVSPASATVPPGASQRFNATELDQFGEPIAITQQIQWTVSGGGTITQTGLFRAGASEGGPFTITATAGTVSGTGSVTITAGLVGYWDLDEGSGTVAADSSGKGNHGTLKNGPTWTTGRIGGALDFDGTNDYVNIGNILSSGASQLTVAAWVKRNSSGDDRIIAKSASTSPSDPSYIFSLSASQSQIGMRLTGTRFWAEGGISNDVWQHLAFTYDGSMIRLYVDGVEIASTPKTGAIPASNVTAVIGNNDPGLNDRYWDGLIDEVRIYERALNASGIAALAVSAPPPNQPPVVNAGADIAVILASPATASLNATATDDGLPDPPGAVTTTWTKVSGLGVVTFADAGALATTASFSAPGIYVLRVTASDGELTASDDLTVTVGSVFGDANLSGAFDIADLYLLVDWLVGRKPEPVKDGHAFAAADVDGDGSISLADVHWMISRLLGRITKFPVES